MQITPWLAVLMACGAFAVPLADPVEPRATGPVSVTVNGVTFVNKGLVAFGLIPSSAKESTGDTLGGIGSAIAIKRGTFAASSKGAFTGSLIVSPDRGYNVETTVDYQARQHVIDFSFLPYYGTAPLSFTAAQATFNLTYRESLFYTDSSGTPTTGLDALGVRPAQNGQPQLPIASSTYNRLSIDQEGLVLNADGSFWVSDEYGPYIYRFSSTGQLLSAIQPPTALLPFVNGTLAFTSDDNPDTGRTPNQGFEGLTASPDGKTLYALLQTATIQDGGEDKETSRYTRLLAWDVRNASSPVLQGEWVVPLPQSKKDKTFGQSEIHYLNPTQFLVLSRDGHGHGDDEQDGDSEYKGIDIVDISGATNIRGTVYDGLTPISPDGDLVSSITPATYTAFVSLIDDDQLERFGLHNDGDYDETLIDAKWESIALAPVLDPAFPDDYFLITVADNDFVTTNGVSVGVPYDAGWDIDTQAFVFRVTLPSVPRGSVQKALGLC